MNLLALLLLAGSTDDEPEVPPVIVPVRAYFMSGLLTVFVPE